MTPKLAVVLLTAAIAWSVSTTCQAQPQPLMTRHVRDAVTSGQAQLIGRLPGSQNLRFDVVLALRHEPELDNFLEELYDPTSPQYRQFVTVKEFAERFGPSQEDYDGLLHFAAVNGLKVVGGSRDAMDVQLSGTVAAIENAFHVTMNTYEHPTENRPFFAPDREPTVDLPFALWHISGLDNYSTPRARVHHRESVAKPDAVKGSCPKSSYCGSDMRAAYYGGTALTGAGQTLGLLEYYGYDIADFNTYFKNAKQTNTVPIHGISTDGTSLRCLSPSCDDTEQTIDMTQAVSMAPGLKSLYVFVGSTDTAILGSMSKHSPLSAQLSCSWGWEPSDPKTDDPFFKKFAAQGQNFFAASGDDGTFNSDSSYVYPADDAYITAVGGTDLQTTKAGGAWASETAWPDGGGGVYTPDAIPIPSWQKLTGVITTQNKGSKTLRNSPDVAAEANFNFYVCADQSGCTANYWGGTSFPTPMWAGYMALVNQHAVANGKKPLGFINPLIYPLGLSEGYDAAFHDITKGSNGKPATKRYDLATGWGSPHDSGLIDALAP